MKIQASAGNNFSDEDMTGKIIGTRAIEDVKDLDAIVEESQNKIVISNKRARLHYGYNEKEGVYYFSISTIHSEVKKYLLNALNQYCRNPAPNRNR